MAGTLTWLGHSSFRLTSPEDVRIYVDPWILSGPCPEVERNPERIDVIALTHGHIDHAGDVPALAERYSPEIIATVELHDHFMRSGIHVGHELGANKGGTVEYSGVRFTFTHAVHSSSSAEGQYLGEAAGIVVTLEDDTAVYFAGDTGVFSDMRLIGELYRPTVAVLPIGDRVTMGPREAAKALELLGTIERCVPCHWQDDANAVLPGRPEHLAELAPGGLEVVRMTPGNSIEL
jgi:L-ascorbate metabolism protein UlaG (beta-lactamase superfamily)